MQRRNSFIDSIIDKYTPTEEDIWGMEFKPPYRFIFENVQFNVFEQTCLSDFKGTETYKELDKAYWNDAQVMRFIQGSQYNLKDSEVNIKNHDKWRLAKPNQETLLAEFEFHMKNGLVYFCGRDNRFRPIVVVNVAKCIQMKVFGEKMKNMMIFVAEHLIESFYIGGKVENWIFLFDLKDVSLFSLPVNSFKELGRMMEQNYRTKLYRFYIVNAPLMMSMLFSFFKLFDKNIQKKIIVSRKKHAKEMDNHVNRAQLENKYNGNMTDIDNYWPYIDRSEDILTG